MTLHEVLAARVKRGDIPGFVTLVARGDDVRADVSGTTEAGGGTPLTRDTIFRITSLTKPVLAAATLILAEDDVLDLEEPIHRLLPELTGQRVLTRPDGPLNETEALHRPATVEDLLTCRMGTGMITEPSSDRPFPIVVAAAELQLALGPPDPRTPWDPDAWMQKFASLPLLTQPGEKWQYDTSYLVLGVLLARAAGQRLGTVLRERMFDPLGMRHTGFTTAGLPEPAAGLPEPAAGLPKQYVGGKEISDPDIWLEEPVFPSGSAGLVSTVDDFHAFARMLLRKGVHGGTRLLSERSVELMTTNRLTPAQTAEDNALLPAGTGWGLGVGVGTVSPEYGWSGGYGTHWFNNPAEDLTAILFTQVSDVLWDGTVTEFRQRVYA
ncbi:serine hydrolase [Actinoplanes sp. TFC3]|uniref:serine hydrolase domain-containing protein n=1 Tax=Actinoplanes sp. TFC3 TaxID=1710355 RepID=UPI000833EB70|nr:serine hydrolase domain-containing protein [Actinoplanes sp. TFC3]